MNHPVLDLLRERIASGSQPGARTDGHTLALAIEGGGMRGVVSCAMAAELARMGGYDAFDTVFGTSAGAFAGAFFVAHQMPLGPPMYYEDLNNQKFISWRRLLRGQPVVRLDFLIQRAEMRIHPLDWRAVAHAKVPLNIVASSLGEGRAKVINRFECRTDLIDALVASATLPYLAGPPVEYKGDLFFDGGLFEPLPVRSAVAAGASHVLVLCSRPKGRYCTPPTAVQRRIVEPRLRKISPMAAESFLTVSQQYRKQMGEIQHSSAHPTAAPFIYGVQLGAHEHEIPRLEKDSGRLRAAGEAGARTLRAALEPETHALAA